jgi:multiple antibiotic resistance protein
MTDSIYSIAFALFLLMDSFGNIPIYLAILKDIEPKRRVKIILREMIISLVLIIIFAFFGKGFFSFLGVSTHSMQISGGIVLFILAMDMIFPKKDAVNYGLNGEPFIFPLAVPLVAGPAVLAAVMIFSKQDISNISLIYAIFIAWAATAIILLLAGKLSAWIDQRGLSALERLMGLILLMLAIEMFLNGLGECVKSSQNFTSLFCH